MSKTMSVELVEALKNAGLQVMPKEELLTPEEQVEKIQELLTVLDEAKKAKDDKLQKKVRRILRNKFGFRLSEWKKMEKEAFGS